MCNHANGIPLLVLIGNYYIETLSFHTVTPCCLLVKWKFCCYTEVVREMNRFFVIGEQLYYNHGHQEEVPSFIL